MAALLWLSALMPRRVIDASADHPAFEHVLGIYLALKFLTNTGPHRQCALWRHISLKPDVLHGELCEAVGDRQRGASVIGQLEQPSPPLSAFLPPRRL